MISVALHFKRDSAADRSLGNTTFFLKFRIFSKNLKFVAIFWKFFEIQFQKLSEIRNLNFVTSELDSESLSTPRKIIFKRDSCKVDDGAAPVIISCMKID